MSNREDKIYSAREANRRTNEVQLNEVFRVIKIAISNGNYGAMINADAMTPYVEKNLGNYGYTLNEELAGVVRVSWDNILKEK